MQRKILIFGCNAFGLKVAERLKDQDWERVLVSGDEACLQKVQDPQLRTAVVDYSEDEALRSLGVGSDVEVVISLFEEDSKNVFLTISVKYIDPTVRVISLCQSEDSSHKLRAAGADKVIDPYQIAGSKVFDIIKRPLIHETIERVVHGQDNLQLAEIEVVAGSPLAGITVDQLELSRHYHLLLLGVVDREFSDEFIFSTSGVDHRLDPGDVLVVIGSDEEIERFRQAPPQVDR